MISSSPQLKIKAIAYLVDRFDVGNQTTVLRGQFHKAKPMKQKIVNSPDYVEIPLTLRMSPRLFQVVNLFLTERGVTLENYILSLLDRLIPDLPQERQSVGRQIVRCQTVKRSDRAGWIRSWRSR